MSTDLYYKIISIWLYYINMDILQKIDKLRIDKGWSMYKLAEESNLPSSTIINMFSRKSLPSIQTLMSICSGLNISVSKFFAETEEDVLSGLDAELLTYFHLLKDYEKKALILFVEKLSKR